MTVAMPPADTVPRSLMRYAPPMPVESRLDDFDLSLGFRLVRRRIAMIAIASAVLTLAAMPAILSLKPLYHAESRLMIHNPLATALGASDTVRAEPLDLASETERLLSRSAAEQVIGKLHLDRLPEFNPALRKPSFFGMLRDGLRGLLAGGGASTAAAASGIERIVPQYYGALTVQRDGPTNVIQIGFNSRDPALAAAVPNALLGVYLDERKANVTGRIDSAEAWVAQRIVEQQQRVRAALDAVSAYREASGPASTDMQSEQVKSLADLNQRHSDLMQSRADLAASISALQASVSAWAGGSAWAGQGVVSEAVANAQRDLLSQQHDLDRLLQTFGDNADEVIEARAKLARSKADLDFAVERFLQDQRAKLAGLDRQATSMQDALTLARQQLSGVALAQTEMTRLLRIADAEQATLDKLVEQRRTLVAQAALPGAEVEVLSPASIPLQPQGRGRLFYLIGAMLASISVAVTAAFILEMMDKSVRSPEQLAGVPGIAPAGFLPVLGERAGRYLPMAFGHSEGGGMFAEAIRAVAISLKHSNGGRLPGSILVTSAHSGEGKSFVARSLAIELVATGHRVLLVDGDLRCGDLGSQLKSGVKVGLNEFLNGPAGLADIVHRHAKSGVDFIPRGNPSLHQRPHLSDLCEIVKMARANGQFVIFDSAPVLASSDTTFLSGVVDRTLVVVQWAGTTRRAVECAVPRLERANGAEILVVINKVQPRRHALYGFRDSELFAKSLRKYHDISL